MRLTTILLVGLLVIAVVFGLWYFWPSLDCTDVEKRENPPINVVYSIVSEADNVPFLVDFGPTAQLRYHFYYETPGNTALLSDVFETLDELEDALEILNIDETDREQAQLIIDCIRADCPGCQVA